MPFFGGGGGLFDNSFIDYLAFIHSLKNINSIPIVITLKVKILYIVLVGIDIGNSMNNIFHFLRFHFLWVVLYWEKWGGGGDSSYC